ncbi:DUF1906 domain-containing protein [Actinocorallia sp. A-T 12471]|uniref:DUF1906 domain-containing protein n=1 Tax=Actinocorallia sp. A-T 12471 TaxID=3089813 RepID=UPI0029CD0F0A|nr:DUF1906 domain-containing protein [Actinocorallia sp. A-T 12471]MDX6744673.1 DUF1906 domain-containing protein [Actinocorallia sp. A-T 12471]
MRRAVILAVGGVTAVSGVLGVTAMTPGPDATALPDAPARTVEYGGLRITVPKGWPVYRLDGDQRRCVRFDEHAVYLGTPSKEPDCPARVVGRTEAIHVTALPAAERVKPDPRRRSARVALSALKVAESADHQMTLDLPRSGVRVTGVYGADRELLERTLRTATSGPGSPPEPEEETEEEIERTPRAWHEGPGFDTCTAPAQRTMRAWREAYSIANIYIGGAARGCAQPRLTKAWVKNVRAMGYRLIPTYVGPQAPCSKFRARFGKDDAADKGVLNADDAVAKARALGIPKGQPLYFDIEAYNRNDKGCRKAVLTFLHAWTERLHELGYKSGVYSSVSSGIKDVAEAERVGGEDFTRPDAIWFARWDGRKRVHGLSYLPDDLWHPHRRIKQYRGGHAEKHGGIKLHVDSNMVDGLVY